MPEKPAFETSKVCLLDFSVDDLRKILNDEKLAKELTEYDESSALARVDELMNLHEAPVTGLLLNDKAVMEIRNEWTITLPVCLAEICFFPKAVIEYP